MKKEQDEVREKRYCFRLSEKESAYFEEQREVSGLTVSEYTRRRVLGFRIVPKIELKMLSEAKKLGGLVKYVFSKTGGMYSQEARDALQALTSFIRKLERLIIDDRKSASRTAG